MAKAVNAVGYTSLWMNLNRDQILGSNLNRHQVLGSNLNHDQSLKSHSWSLWQRAQDHHLFKFANLIHDRFCNGCKFTTPSHSNSPPVQIVATAIYNEIDSQLRWVYLIDCKPEVVCCCAAKFCVGWCGRLWINYEFTLLAHKAWRASQDLHLCNYWGTRPISELFLTFLDFLALGHSGPEVVGAILTPHIYTKTQGTRCFFYRFIKYKTLLNNGA